VSSTLVERRADIRVAEENLHAASAQIGVATANMLPNISLTAAWGATANHIGDLFGPGTTAWNVTAGLTQPIFQGGMLLHKRRAAVAGYDQALAQYRSAVVTAFQNVGDALAAIQYDTPAFAAAEATEHAAADTLQIATRQVELGQASYLALLAAQQTHQQAVAARIQAEASRFTDTVALFQALGGDWWSAGGAFAPTQQANGS
jgi:NodT family efflux transporter outer membrane factor (OMF) lipoprotein